MDQIRDYWNHKNSKGLFSIFWYNNNITFLNIVLCFSRLYAACWYFLSFS
ncbi:hypothetical protein HMPREF1394_00191 [Helicobacter pylori GAM105Ai]|nr:hypothetical protein HMPREF1394_00191 [Helicobacter pylori GAM105Ai]